MTIMKREGGKYNLNNQIYSSKVWLAWIIVIVVVVVVVVVVPEGVDIQSMEVIQIFSPITPTKHIDLPPPLNIISRMHITWARGLTNHLGLHPFFPI